MRRIAFLADVHANLEALEATLHDVESQGPDQVIVLGDTINYGPNPRECLTLCAIHADVLLAGNHEKEAALPDPDELEDDAREMLSWTVAQLAGLRVWEKLRDRIVAHGARSGLDATGQGEDPAQARVAGLHCVHASAAKPYAQYVWPGHPNHHLHLNGALNEYLCQILAGFDAVHSFVGHTHVPAILAAYASHALFPVQGDWNRRLTFVGPGAIFYVPQGGVRIEGLAGHKLVINPGSVGQPRDGDARAAWALYDGDSVEFRRVPYDHAAVAAKIRALPFSEGTRTYFADRLAVGR